MIHTITIHHRLEFNEVRELLERTGLDSEYIQNFIWENDKRRPIKRSPGILGVEEIGIMPIKSYNRNAKIHQNYYIIYIRLEPLTMVTGNKHIQLFECSDSNIAALCNEFRIMITDYFSLDGQGDQLYFLTDLKGWDAQRIDYTVDIKLRNHDEVLLFINLAKLATLSTARSKQKEHSVYGKHFFDDSFTFGNKTWELTIYDKEAQITNKSNLLPETIQQLVEESSGIARIEYRRLTSGTKTRSTHYESRSIMEFLSEVRAEEWLHGSYGSIIGYEDFASPYHAEQCLSKAYPLNASELKEDRRARRSAGDKHTPRKLGKKAQKLLDYMTSLVSHKGINNAFAAAVEDASLSGKDIKHVTAAARAKCKDYEKAIRAAGISPVMIPHAWLYKRLNKQGKPLDIPHDIFVNPVKRP